MTSAIQVDNLCKSFFSRPIVKGVSFTVAKNTIHGFLGPNGAGKSTTMKMLAGILKPDSGEIWVEGINYQENPIEYKKLIGILPENPPVYDDMRVIEYLTFVAELYQLSKVDIQRNLEQALVSLGLQNVAKQLIGQLSKGFKQKVGIAQAIMSNPSIVILDEPTIGLDPNAVLELREYLRNLAKTKTILFSSHQLHEVSQLCENLTLIHQGEVFYSGSIENVLGQFERGHKFTLVLQHSIEQTKDFLSTLSYISDIKLFHNQVEFFLQGGEEQSKNLFKLLVDKGIPVLEFKRSALALEETFLHLSQRQRPQEERSK
jgi:ABC-2 type transport system ATP-binding protein